VDRHNGQRGASLYKILDGTVADDGLSGTNKLDTGQASYRLSPALGPFGVWQLLEEFLKLRPLVRMTLVNLRQSGLRTLLAIRA